MDHHHCIDFSLPIILKHVAVGCSGFKFFFVFVFFFLCRFPCLLLLQRKIMKFQLLDLLFPFFLYAIFLGFLVSWDSSIWFQFWVCFSMIYSVFLILILHWFGFSFSLYWLCNFCWIFCFPGLEIDETIHRTAKTSPPSIFLPHLDHYIAGTHTNIDTV